MMKNIRLFNQQLNGYYRKRNASFHLCLHCLQKWSSEKEKQFYLEILNITIDHSNFIVSNQINTLLYKGLIFVKPEENV